MSNKKALMNSSDLVSQHKSPSWGMKNNYLKHLVSTKGAGHLLVRSGQILTRFARGKQNFSNMLDVLANEPQFQKSRITFCVTASVLDSHVLMIRRLSDSGFDLASHGYFHIDMQRKTKPEQSIILSDTYRAFHNAGLTVTGFRCPYLSYNWDTIESIEAGPFQWTSNDLYYWNTRSGFSFSSNGLGRLGSLYHLIPAARYPCLPRIVKGIVNIPITAPDDEMVVERQGIKDASLISRIWLENLEHSHRRGELLHLLFHPERFKFVHTSVREVLNQARTMEFPVWITSLSALSEWWSQRSRSRWAVRFDAAGRCTASIHAPVKSTVLLKSMPNPAAPKPVYRDYYPCPPLGTSGNAKVYPAGEARRWTIGVSSQTPGDVEHFLQEEGFAVERSEDPASHSYYIDRPQPFEDQHRLPILEALDNCPHPLLRLWRWPEDAQSALAISVDVDAITISDFFRRAFHF